MTYYPVATIVNQGYAMLFRVLCMRFHPYLGVHDQRCLEPLIVYFVNVARKLFEASSSGVSYWQGGTMRLNVAAIRT